jgi:hypothetical protein
MGGVAKGVGSTFGRLVDGSLAPLKWAGSALGFGETPGLPEPPGPPPTIDDAKVAQQKADAARRRRGRAATYLTTPRGVASTPVGTRALTGA